MNNNQDPLNMARSGNDVPAACFLNSLARECSTVQIVKDAYEAYYQIPLSEGREIRIPLRYVSAVGLHEYQFPAIFYSEKSETISFDKVLELILNETALVGLISDEQKSIFSARVRESYRNTYMAVSESPYAEQLFEQPLNFQQAEQGLLIGHSFHPAPKSREQFSYEDAKVYSPEFGGKFALRWLAVDKSVTVFGSSGEKDLEQRLGELVEHDSELAQALESQLGDNDVLLPVHPWQWGVFQQHTDVQEYVVKGQVRDLGVLGSHWFPTSSTRSLYAPSLPYMLKFSLSVKLTNSIRNLSLKEVIRGTRLNQLFNDTEISDVLGDKQGFQLMQEPAYVGLVDKQGNVIDESLVAFRDNPLSDKPEEEAVVLATLTQQNPYGGESLVASRIKQFAQTNQLTTAQAALKWFSAYCQHTVVPLFNLQANFGVVFLAHQQNIVIQMEQGFPIGMYYRDCQGTGYTDLAFDRFSTSLNETKQDIENYWDQDKVRRYFAYYLIINSTFNVIGSIAANCDVDEKSLVKILHQQLEALKEQGVRDSQCLNYVLESDALCCKGNFYCYLQNFNENSIPDPAVIYFDLPNPLIHAKDAINV